MTATAIVFGATGYLGSHVAEQLVEAGQDVTCIVRQHADVRFLTALGVRIETVDFTRPQDLAALIPADANVFNCIADTRTHVRYHDKQATDVDLSVQLFTCSQHAGARRFIQLSTVMVYGFGLPATPVAEDDLTTPNHPDLEYYCYNRIAAERELRLLNQHQRQNRPTGTRQHRTELSILRPANALGKRDKAFLPNFNTSNREITT